MNMIIGCEESTITDYGHISFEQVSKSVWIVRGHEEGFGSEYSWGFVLVKTGDKGIAKFMISADDDNKLMMDDIKSIRDFIRCHGMKHVEYTRIKPSGKTLHKLK